MTFQQYINQPLTKTIHVLDLLKPVDVKIDKEKMIFLCTSSQDIAAAKYRNHLDPTL